MRGKCKQCGTCCKVIVLSYSMEELKQKGDADCKFIIDNWIEIPKVTAYALNPHLIKWGLYEALALKQYYFSCTKLINNKCSIYENRPRICVGYPWYDNRVYVRDPLYSEKCGFKIDQIVTMKV